MLDVQENMPLNGCVPNANRAGRVFAFTICFIAVIAGWGIIDTIVQIISKNEDHTALIIYSALAVVCLVIIRIYQMFDHHYDPVKDMGGQNV